MYFRAALYFKTEIMRTRDMHSYFSCDIPVPAALQVIFDGIDNDCDGAADGKYNTHEHVQVF